MKSRLSALADIQQFPDKRGIPIQQVGVADLSYPVTVLDHTNSKQATVARVSMSVDLSSRLRGTHMSRFIEVLSEHSNEITMHTMPMLLAKIKKRLCSKTARMEISFPYFIEREAPLTGAKAKMDCQCAFLGESGPRRPCFTLQVTVPVSTLCPCSKEISDYGAHNQRGYVTISIRPKKKKSGAWEMVWIEELVEIAEKSSSSPVYPLLKRPDERYVTMHAFNHPVFVEDIVREASARLKKDKRIERFEVRAVSHESIHNHSAFATVTC